MLHVKKLKTYFRVGGQFLKAVDGIDLAVSEGEIVGLVGESGCGKSVTALSILRLVEPPGEIIEGEVLWYGQDVLKMNATDLRRLRGGQISMVFQNPSASLNPVFTIGSQLIEAIRLHQKLSRRDAHAKAVQLLGEVKIPDPSKRIHDYPHQFSGGMCQRIMIAIALSSNPKLLIADEPTASLDVTIQAQILELLMEIKEKFKMAVLLISHDLGVIAQNCDRVAVMYLGRIVELADIRDLYKSALHPYTRALLASVPIADPEQRKKAAGLKGDVPSPVNLPAGCRFQDRCGQVIFTCRQEDPQLAIKKPSHWAACFNTNR